MCSICPLGYMCTKCLMVSRPGRNWSHALLRVKKIFDVFNSFWNNTNPAKTIFLPPFLCQGSVTAAFSPKALENPPWSGPDGTIHPPVHWQCWQELDSPDLPWLVQKNTKLIDATKTDSAILHRSTFCVTLCKHLPQTELLRLFLLLFLLLFLPPTKCHWAKQKNTSWLKWTCPF